MPGRQQHYCRSIKDTMISRMWRELRMQGWLLRYRDKKKQREGQNKRLLQQREQSIGGKRRRGKEGNRMKML